VGSFQTLKMYVSDTMQLSILKFLICFANRRPLSLSLGNFGITQCHFHIFRWVKYSQRHLGKRNGPPERWQVLFHGCVRPCILCTSSQIANSPVNLCTHRPYTTFKRYFGKHSITFSVTGKIRSGHSLEVNS
jgi:hypothetical protein